MGNLQDFEAFVDEFFGVYLFHHAPFPDVESHVIMALKHVFCLEEVISSLSSDDMINALHFPYLDESTLDLSGTTHLAAKGHLRQSQVLLRCALEDAVIHYYHTSYGRSFDASMNHNDRRMPSFRTGRGNMLADLQSRGFIDAELFRLLDLCYGGLNPYVHSHIRTLTVRSYGDSRDPRELILLWSKNTRNVAHALILLVLAMLEKNL